MTEEKDKSENIIKDIYSLLKKDIKKDNDIPNDSFEKIDRIYSIISNKLDEIKQNKEQNYNLDFSKNFEDLKNKQIVQINNSLNDNEPNYIYTIKSLNSKVILYNFLNEVFLQKYLCLTDEETFNIMKNITNNLISNYNNLANITFKLMENYELMNEEINNLNMEIYKKDKYLRQLSDKIIILKEKLNKNKQENELISIKLFNNNMNNQIIESYNNNIKFRNKKLYSKNLTKSQSLSSFNSKNDKLYLNNKILKQKNILSNNSRENIINNLYINNSCLTGNRIITNKMLKDIIYNIYNSKNIFNNKCLENKQPKETMEQYMYTFFNYKYGLKNMVIEWATNIINGIKTYSFIDSEICLFGKILRNDLDESCQFIMPKIKKIVEENIIKIFKKVYGLKKKEDIIEYKNKLIKNRFPLNIIQLILGNLYSQVEQEKILPKIKEMVNEYKNRISNNEIDVNNNILYDLNCKKTKDNPYHNKLSRMELNQKLLEKENELNSISFNELINIFHEYEINKKENYIKSFVVKFKKFDDNSDGILDENQFINLIKELNILEEKNYENSLHELLNLVDPYGYKKFIFTDCIESFSSYNIGNKNIFDMINSKSKEEIGNGKN